MSDLRVKIVREERVPPMFVPSRQTATCTTPDGRTYEMSGIATGDRGPGGHYTVSSVTGDVWAWLEGIACDDINFFFPSTSGVHGSYVGLDEIERYLFGRMTKQLREELDLGDGEDRPASYPLTFCFVMPRMCTIVYGNVEISTREHVAFIRELVEQTVAGVQERCAGARRKKRKT